MTHNENESFIDDDDDHNSRDDHGSSNNSSNNSNNSNNTINYEGITRNNSNSSYGDFTDIRLSSSNNKTKTTTTTTTATITNNTNTNNYNSNNKVDEIELNELNGHNDMDDLESGVLLNDNHDNNNSSSNDDHASNDDEDEKVQILESENAPPPPIPRHIMMRVMVIYFAVFCDGLSLTLIQPFLPKLLTDKWGYPEEDVGYLSGLLVGVYSFARFGSGFYLGHFSDKYGRKPFLVMSLFATGIGTVIFSNMPNVWLAIGLRMFEGLFSNTTALCQATLADMVDKRNRASVFAYLGGTYALSRCISSSMGGFVVKAFSNTENPYFYACVIGGAIVLLSAFMVLILHPETHPKYTKLDYSHHYQSLGTKKEEEKEEEKEENGASNKSKQANNVSFKDGMKMILNDRAVLLLIVVGGLNSYCNGGLLLSLVLFSSLSVNLKGLGFDPSGTGIIFTILGFFGFVWQVTLFKKLSLTMGLKRQFTGGMMLLCIGMAIFPLTYIGLIKSGTVMTWVIIFISVPIISVGFMNGLPLVGAMIGTVCQPEIQGLTQGTTQSINSMLRSFGPTLSGALFSWSSNKGIPWLLFINLSSLYVVIAVISLYLPDKVDANASVIKHRQSLKKKKKEQKEDKQSLTEKV